MLSLYYSVLFHESRLARNPKPRFCHAIAHGVALMHQAPRHSRTWTQTEADHPQLQLNGSCCRCCKQLQVLSRRIETNIKQINEVRAQVDKLPHNIFIGS